jgi:hypothetical protein
MAAVSEKLPNVFARVCRTAGTTHRRRLKKLNKRVAISQHQLR